eukprot:1892067-Amphidinium_carterae.2
MPSVPMEVPMEIPMATQESSTMVLQQTNTTAFLPPAQSWHNHTEQKNKLQQLNSPPHSTTTTTAKPLGLSKTQDHTSFSS